MFEQIFWTVYFGGVLCGIGNYWLRRNYAERLYREHLIAGTENKLLIAILFMTFCPIINMVNFWGFAQCIFNRDGCDNG